MLASGIFSLAALAGTVLGATVSYDTGYDDGNRSLRLVACSDGDNGLISRYKWETQAQIPRFPYIGGTSVVGGWNSSQCGSCWKLDYRSRSVTVLAIDHVGAGFNIGLHALNELTGGRAVEVGRIEAQATQVDVKQCGL